MPTDSGLSSREVTVRSGADGEVVPAMLAVCSQCGHDTWTLYSIRGKYQHLQCCRCGTTYCAHEGPGCAGDRGGQEGS